MADQQEAAAQMLERMKQRTEDLAQRAEQRRVEKESQAASSENSDYFLKNFQQMKVDIEGKVAGAESVDKAKMTTYFDELVHDAQKLQQLLNESSMFLASFQIKRAQDELNSVNTLIHDKIEEMQPKKKFGFGKKKPEKSRKTRDGAKDDTDAGMTPAANAALDDLIQRQFFGFRDERDATLSKTQSELEHRQLTLHNLERCRVVCLGSPSTVQMASLSHCTVLLGPTARSIFIKDCSHCQVVVACQQVRIHCTTDTQFYLHVTGAAIIEDCQRVQFAPYNLQYPDLQDHWNTSGLDPHTNYWDKIEDFHWLNENESSPNWWVLPEEDRCHRWLQ